MSLIIEPMLWFANLSAVGLGSITKLPQVFSLIKSNSSKGINLEGLISELMGYSIMLSYNIFSRYPLMSYFEYPLLVVQDIVMIGIFFIHNGRPSPTMVAYAAVFSIFLSCFIMGYIPIFVMLICVNMCTPFSAFSKLIQLKSIVWKKDSTGVSTLTWVLSAYTNLARVFTIYVETTDISLLVNFGVSTILASLVVIAIHVYKPHKKLD